jgi:transmembrane sensor
LDKKTILTFIDRFLAGQSNKIENQKLNEFFESFENDKDAQKHLDENPELKNKIFNKIQLSVSDSTTKAPVRHLFTGFRMAAAMLVLLGLSTLSYWILSPMDKSNELAKLTQPKKTEDKNPAKNIAILTLANKSTIMLDETSSGEIAVESGISITKTPNGDLIYIVKNLEKNQNNTEEKYNTITTPKGGKFNVILPDGSLVMLNAASSLTYPVYFKKNERSVSFNGEAYFEIAKAYGKDHQRIPFFVHSKDQVVEVLGTHFNINSYDNEDFVKTTLLEGSVKIIKNESPITAKYLVPGQQALTKAGLETKIVKADAQQIIAWKEGYFMFKNSNIKEIANELERWYDVDIEYADNIAFESITGYISRNVKISNVLRMLELSGIVSYEIKGRKIILKTT